MKKKLIVLLLLVALTASLFTGCTLIKENAEREANEVLATVSSDGITLTVTKNELLTYVNYILNMYSQSGYSYTPEYETMFPQVLDTLISQKYQVIKGIVYLNSINDRKASRSSTVLGISKNTAEGCLTVAERYAAINAINDSFEDEIETYKENYRSEKTTLVVQAADKEVKAYKDDGYAVDHLELAKGFLKSEYYSGESLNTKKAYVADFSDFDYDTKAKLDELETASGKEAVAARLAEAHDESNVFIYIVLTKKDEATVRVPYPYTDSFVDSDNAFTSTLDSGSTVKTTKTIKYKYADTVKKDGVDTYEYRYTQDAEGNDYTYTLYPTRTAREAEAEVDVLEKDRYSTDATYKDVAKFNANGGATREEKDAYRQFREAKKNMLIGFEENGLNYYYSSQFESAVLNAVKYECAKSIAVSDDDVNTEYNILFNRQRAEYELLGTDDEKVTKFTGSIVSNSDVALGTTYYVPVDALKAKGLTDLSGFFAVKHILFKFNEEQTSFLTSNCASYTGDQLDAILDTMAPELKSDRSNPYYDPKFECSCTDHTDATDVAANCADKGEHEVCPSLAYDPNGKDVTVLGTVAGTVQADLKAALSAVDSDTELDDAAKLQKKFEIFDDYTYKYSDDSSIGFKNGYLICPEEVGNGWTEAFTNFARDNYEGGVGSTGDLKYVYYVGNGTYAVHFMMVTMIPFANGEVNMETGALSLNAAINTAGDTLMEQIRSSVMSTRKSKAYSDWTAQYNVKEAKKNAEVSKSKLKKLFKDFELDTKALKDYEF